MEFNFPQAKAYGLKKTEEVVQGVTTALSTIALLYAQNKAVVKEHVGTAPVAQLDKALDKAAAGAKDIETKLALDLVKPVVNHLFQGHKEDAQKTAAELATALGKVHLPNGVAVVVSISKAYFSFAASLLVLLG